MVILIYRGASPVIQHLLNGDQIGGVSFIEMSPKKFDYGKIILQKSQTISIFIF